METRYLGEILRLHYREGIERTAIASSLGISYTTVTRTLRKAEANGGEEIEALADPELEALFYPARPGPKTRVNPNSAFRVVIRAVDHVPAEAVDDLRSLRLVPFEEFWRRLAGLIEGAAG